PAAARRRLQRRRVQDAHLQPAELARLQLHLEPLRAGADLLELPVGHPVQSHPERRDQPEHPFLPDRRAGRHRARAGPRPPGDAPERRQDAADVDRGVPQRALLGGRLVIRRRRPSLGNFAPNEAGVSAVEFAFIAPVLILAYFGCAELCGAMLAERKASHTASAIGDLVAQASTVSTSDLTNIFTVGDIIMSPDPTNTLGMRVTSVQADASGATTVGWSQASGTMTALPKNGAITIPSNLIAANQ